MPMSAWKMHINCSLENTQILHGWEHSGWNDIPHLSCSHQKRGRKMLCQEFFLMVYHIGHLLDLAILCQKGKQGTRLCSS